MTTLIDRLAVAALLTVLFGSSLDAYFTLSALSSGGAESNPLMAWLINQHQPATFAGVKLALSALGGGLLYHRREHHWALLSLGLLADSYIILVVAHLYFGSTA